jgi:hypothetical protein
VPALIYDILSPTNSTLLTADMILLCAKILFLTDDSHTHIYRQMSPELVQPSSNLVSCISTLPNLHFKASLLINFIEPNLKYRLQIFQIPISCTFSVLTSLQRIYPSLWPYVTFHSMSIACNEKLLTPTKPPS